MSDISAEWKELRSKIGNFTSHMNSTNEQIDARLKKLQEKEEQQADLQTKIDEAYNKGIVCSGLSAGSYCWFKLNYDLLKGLGIINAVNCVHYEQKDKEYRDKFYNVIKETGLDGIALDNCVALELVDDKMKIIKSDNNRNAYKISYKDNHFVEEMLD